MSQRPQGSPGPDVAPSRCCLCLPGLFAQHLLQSSSRAPGAQQRGGASGKADVQRGRAASPAPVPYSGACECEIQFVDKSWLVRNTGHSVCRSQAVSGSSAAGMHSMSCLPALAEADVSLEERWLLQDVAA